MSAPRRVTTVQFEELVAWMESHPLQARATQINTPQAKQSTQRLWDELASRLNAVGNGVSKSAKEWRQYWTDQKCKVKKKGSEMRQHICGTGGGSPWNGILTPIEDRILAIMGVQNVIGNENVRIYVDMGLDDAPPEPLQTSSQLVTSELYEVIPSLSVLPDSQGMTDDGTINQSHTAQQGNTDPASIQPCQSQTRPSKRKHVATCIVAACGKW